MNSRTNSELQNSRHRNQVKLLGCCIEGEEKMLVYEYMTNRSLDLILFHPVNNIVLDWAKRSNIINGIARAYSRGLMYLHQDSRMYLHQDSRLRVIHRDLKASNILLDSDMNPKISDFGLARTFGGDDTGANTSRVIGTYGYMSPEYAMEGLFSVKSDVFSFGVLEVKIVSGKGNKWFYHGDRRVNLVGHAWMLYKEERSLELVDVCVRNTCDDWSEVIELIHIMHSLLHILQHHIYSVQHSKRIIRMFLVVVDSGDYAALLEYLKGGQEDQQFRRRLA